MTKKRTRGNNSRQMIFCSACDRRTCHSVDWIKSRHLAGPHFDPLGQLTDIKEIDADYLYERTLMCSGQIGQEWCWGSITTVELRKSKLVELAAELATLRRFKAAVESALQEVVKKPDN